MTAEVWDDATEVPIVLAAPLEQLHQPGEFWAFFPTLTNSLLAGILNAPWKTNEDRQNLLTGEYNEELIGAVAELIAESIADLSSCEEPSRHLDALPRRQEASDNEHSILLRYQLNVALRSRPDCSRSTMQTSQTVRVELPTGVPNLGETTRLRGFGDLGSV